MVQAPLRPVQPQRCRGTLPDHPGHDLRGRCIAGRGVLLVKQLLREAAKIMDGFGLVHGGEPPAFGEPMGRNAQDELRPGPRRPKFHAQRLPAAPVLVVANRVHRTAVPKKQHRHSFGFFEGDELLKCGAVGAGRHGVSFDGSLRFRVYPGTKWYSNTAISAVSWTGKVIAALYLRW